MRFWDPCSQCSVTGNFQIFLLNDFLHFRVPNGGPKGPLPWDPLGSQGFPSHGIPWAPKGSPPMGPPPDAKNTNPGFPYLSPKMEVVTDLLAVAISRWQERPEVDTIFPQSLSFTYTATSTNVSSH